MKMEYDGSREAYSRKESMRAAVIAHGNSPPVFDPAKHDLDLISLFIQFFVVRDGFLAILFGRDAGRKTSGEQGITEPVGVIPTVRQKLLSLRQSIYKQGGSFVVAHLTFWERHGHGPAETVANGMEFCVQPAFCASDTAGKSPFLSRLAAVR